VFMAAASLACRGSDHPLEPVEVTGTYTASEFITSLTHLTVDQLDEGVTLTITLAADGSTEGALVVPAAGGEPVDLRGTWVRQGSVVTFHLPASDTFLDSLPFQVEDRRLVGNGVVGGTTFHITLVR